jgi:hypothetical protein
MIGPRWTSIFEVNVRSCDDKALRLSFDKAQPRADCTWWGGFGSAERVSVSTVNQ